MTWIRKALSFPILRLAPAWLVSWGSHPTAQGGQEAEGDHFPLLIVQPPRV